MITETKNPRISIVGFGGQGRAWARILSARGWDVKVYLRPESARRTEALALGLSVHSTAQLVPALEAEFAATGVAPAVALLISDLSIKSFYEETLKRVNAPLRLVVAHGFSVSQGGLKPELLHNVFLFAPKAIGEELTSEALALPTLEATHDLVAGVFAPKDVPKDLEKNPDRRFLADLGKGLGFHPDRQIWASFEAETLGDLVSEQYLLVGGVYSLLLWTIEEMRRLKVPDALIRAECLKELKLIATVLDDRGPAKTFDRISQVAQAGTVEIQKRFEESNLALSLRTQLNSILDGSFAARILKKESREQIKDFRKKLEDISL